MVLLPNEIWCGKYTVYFEEGQKHISYYDTQYGTFAVGVTTRSVKVDVDMKVEKLGLIINRIDNNKQGGNDFHMFIREAGQINDECCGSIESVKLCS